MRTEIRKTMAIDHDELARRMPIAKSLLTNDTAALSEILQERVFRQATLQTCTIEQTFGHAFTGGRSTPVYRITCQLKRKKDGAEKKRHFIAKLVQMNGKNPGSNQKRRESYAVERRFYDHPELAETFRSVHGLTLPKIILGDLDGKEPYPTVCWIMNDLSQSGFPLQVPVLSVDQAKAALAWLAKFHALGWHENEHVAWKQHILHSRGGFWTNIVSTSDSNKFDQLPTQWKNGLAKLEPFLGSGDHGRLVRMGQRLQAICQHLEPFLNQQCKWYGTWIHGDFKAANMLFAEEIQRDEATSSSPVAVVDFQFTGWGLCAEDVAYMLYPDAQGSLMESIDELLDFYHYQLVNEIMSMMKGGPSSISREKLTGLFDMALIDLTRYWLSKGWEGTTRGEAELVLRLEKTVDAIFGNAIASDGSVAVDSKNLQSYLDSTP
jgi:Ecdysteroid kinase-like family